MKKKRTRNKNTGRYENEYNKAERVATQVELYLHGLDWRRRLQLFLPPTDFTSQAYTDLKKTFKRLEDIDQL